MGTEKCLRGRASGGRGREREGDGDVPRLQKAPTDDDDEHEMAFRHCLSTFVPYPLTERERQREIVDGLIAGQKRQEGRKEGRLVKCLWAHVVLNVLL